MQCKDSNQILQNILEKHGHIDILKIDIETLEEAVTTRIPLEFAAKIKKIYVEFPFATNPLERTHTFRQYGTVAQFINKSTIFAKVAARLTMLAISLVETQASVEKDSYSRAQLTQPHTA